MAAEEEVPFAFGRTQERKGTRRRTITKKALEDIAGLKDRASSDKTLLAGTGPSTKSIGLGVSAASGKSGASGWVSSKGGVPTPTRTPDGRIASPGSTGSKNSLKSIMKERGVSEQIEGLLCIQEDNEVSFSWEHMRCMALVADGLMIPALIAFVAAHKDTFSRFRLVGTSELLDALAEALPDVDFAWGPSCCSIQFGGLSQVATLVVTGEVGGIVLFNDPLVHMSYAVELDQLVRQSHVHNIVMMQSLASGVAMIRVIEECIQHEQSVALAPFFASLESPSVAEYKKEQAAVAASLNPTADNSNGLVRKACACCACCIGNSKKKSEQVASKDPLASLKREKTIQLTPSGATPAEAVNPTEMRMLALVAHNHMKPAMKAFAETHRNILRHFVLCGTETTMKVLRNIFKDDPDVEYGPAFTSGPLGGDAQCGALMCLHQLGGMIFFQDPLSAHPHQPDIAALVRLSSIENIAFATNPVSATILMLGLKGLLETNSREHLPSFFTGSISPAIASHLEKGGESAAIMGL